ncbi:tandem-95 repeat protein [Chitinolyticbacter meiyuanensis]|uniref:tandem-95 repeat protein n=1 Tax=Chitinolyticbacter meiyuanensis TaxID=682798 RepID=UPI0011E59B83|nr:Ig-like domain-containing protein [Chitinolyticbacter meiyuanensis]
MNGQLTATDVDGDPLSFSKGSDPAHGTVTVNPDGSWTYTPNANYNGSDSFTVTVSDGQGGTDTVTVNVGITPVADPAVIGGDDQGAVTEDLGVVAGKLSDTGTLTVSDPDAGQSSFSAGAATPVGATLGGLTIDAAGHWTYQVDNAAVQYLKAGETKTEQFTVQSADGTSHVISVVITGTNDGPVANADVASTAINTPLSNIDVLANDTDVDGNPLTVTNASLVDPSKGTVTLNPDGTLNFVPASNVTGPVSISYQIKDSEGATATGTLTVNVGANTPPTGADQTVTLLEDGSHGFSAGDFGFNDSDVGQTFQAVRIDSLPGAGSLTLNGVPVSANQVINVADLGNLVFTPAANANGVGYASFTFSVQDSAGGFDTVPNTVRFNVTAVNDAPIAAPDSNTTAEDTPLTVTAANGLLANDSDVDGNPLTITQFSVANVAGTFTAGQTATIAGVGSLTINGNGSYSFVPAANYNGPVPVATYTVSDGTTTATSTLTLNVTAVADPTVTAPDTLTVAEDSGTSTGNVLSNDSDPDGPLSVSQFVVSGTTYTIAAGGSATATLAGVGTLVMNSNGSYSFTPATNYNGSVPPVTYTATDGTSSATNTLTISVTAVDDPSVLAPDSKTVAEDNVASGNVLSNDSDVDNVLSVASFSVTGVPGSFSAGQTATLAGVGSFTLGSNGDYTFTPVANWNGNVPQVNYTTNTGSSSTLNITVTAVNDAPIAAPDSNTTAEDTPLTVTAANGLLANDSDVDGNPLTITQFSVANVAGTFTAGQTATIAGVGSLTINGNGSYSFVPAANYNGPVPVATYTVSDGTTTATSTLTLNVTAVADPTVTAPDTLTVAEDSGTSTGNVLSNDSDPDGPLSVSQFVVSGTTYTIAAGGSATATLAGVGTLVMNSNGSYSFTPATNYNGSVPPVTYTATDGTSSATNTLTISVTAVDDPSVLAPDSKTVAEDNVASGNVLSNDSDVDNVLSVASFSVTGVPGSFSAGQTATLAGVGSFTLGSNGDYTFTPVANWNGNVPQVNYTTNTGSSSTLNITVTAVNDAPIAAPDSNTTAEDTPLTVTAANGLLANDSDVDGNPLTITQFSVANVAGTFTAGQTATIAGVGSLTINGNGSYSFVPAANYNGPVPVATYTVSDGTTTATSTLTLNVTAVADPTVTAPDTLTVAEDSGTSTGNVLSNDSDPDGPLSVSQFVVSGTTYTIAAGGSATATLAGVGTLVMNSNGSYSFTPATNYNGSVPPVTYTATDGTSSATNTLTISVTAVDDPSVLAPDSKTVAEDNVASGNVLSNDSDVDNVLSVASFSVTGVPGSFSAGQTATLAGVGSFTLGSNGDYTFTPVANWNGNVPQVNYTTNTGSSSTLNITVTAVNDAPIAAPDSNTTAEDTPLTVTAANGLLANDSDVDGNPLTITQFSVANVAGTFTAGQTATIAGVGSLTINGNGSYSFVPAANYNGPVPVATYTVSDGTTTATSTLTLNVTAVADPTVTAPDTLTVAEDSGTSTGNVLSNDSDPDGPLSVSQFVVSGTTYTIAAGGSATATLAGVGTLVMNSNGSYSFTPATNYNGSVPPVTYTATDGTSSATNTLTISVTAVDDPSVLAPDSKTVAEDNVASGNVLSNDSDVDNVLSVASFSVTGVPGSFSAGQTATLAGVGSFTLGSNGDYTFTPVANWNGNVPQVNYTTNTGSSSTLNITVTAVNDAPVPQAVTASGNEDTVIAVNLSGTDVDGTVASFKLTGLPANGTFYSDAAATNPLTLASVINATSNGATIYFKPNADWNGTNSFQYSATDNNGLVSTSNATGTITVNSVNDAPVPQAVTASGNEDTVIAVALKGTDVDGTVASFKLTGLPANGTFYSDAAATNPLTLASVINATSNGATIYFKPNADWNGTNSFQYSATDNNGLVSTSNATGTLTVLPVNDAPVAVNDPGTLSGLSAQYYAYHEGTDGANLTSLTMVRNFIAANTADATFVAKSFNYTLGNGDLGGNGNLQTFLGSDSASLNVDPENSSDAIIRMAGTVQLAAGTYNFKVTADDGYIILIDGVMVAQVNANQSPTGTVHPTFTVAEGGAHTIEILYWDQGGQAVFKPELSNNGGTSYQSLGSYTLGQEQPAFVTTEDNALTISPAALLGNDSDVDGDILTIVSVQAATHGSVALVNGNVVFTPASNYFGPASFTYTISDGHGGTSTATVNLNVTSVNDAPVPQAVTASGNEDTVIAVNLSGTDVDGTVASFKLTGLPANGTFYSDAAATNPLTLASVINATSNGATIYFKPNADWNGTNSFQYSATDNNGLVSTSNATGTITVNSVNDAPVPQAVTATGNEDTVIAVALKGTDVDGTVASFKLTGLPGNGTFYSDAAATNPLTLASVINATSNGATIYFKPNADWNGTNSFQYSATDNNGLVSTSNATGTITVNSVNDAPVPQAVTATGNEDTVIAVNLSGTDVDGTVASFKLTGLPGNGTFYSDAAATNPLTLASVINATSNGATIYFKPNADWNGTNSFQYSATDNNGLVSTSNATGTITVNAVNDAPTTTGGSVTGTEDTPLVLTWSQFNASDVDTPASGLSVKMIGLPADGTVQYNNGSSWVTVTANQLVSKADIDAGKLRFVPDTHESGSNAYSTTGTGDQKSDYAKFTYQISDGSVTSSTATMTVDITPVADKPTLTLNAPAAQTVFNTTWESVANSDDSSEGVNATTLEGWTLVTTPDSFSGGLNRFEVWSSGDQISNQAGTMITGVGAPGGNGNWLELNNASSNSLPQTLGIERSVSTAVGQVYTLSFDYAGRSGYSTAYTQIAILVDGVKVATYSSTSPQGGLNWEELKYSFTGDGNAHTIRIITDATSFDSSGRGAMIDDIKIESSSGIVAGNASGGKTEVTLANYVSGQLVDTDGSESLTYRFTGLPTGTVITTSGNSSGYVISNGGITISAAELASAKLVLPSSYTSGTLNVGVSSIATEGANASSDSTSGTLTLNVMATGLSKTTVTDTGSPVAVADSYTTPEDQSITFNPLSNDTLRDGARIAGFTQPANGSLTLNADGTLTYNPPANYNGTTTFSYTLIDGNGQNSTATVTLNVTPVNDAPVVDSHSITAKEGVPTALAIAAPTDVDGDRLTVTITGLPTQGTVMTEGGTVVQNGQVISINQLQNLVYVSPTTITSTTNVGSLSYRVNDGTTSTNGAIAITVTDNPNVITGHDGVGTYYVDGAESGAGNTFYVASSAYNAGNGQPAGGYDLRTVTTTGKEQVIFTGGSNDHVEAGAGNDIIFMGETQSNDNSVALTTQAEMFTGSRNMFMTTADSNLLNSSDKLVQTVVNQMQPVSDLANAGSGDDVIYGQGGTDALYGGAGDDKLYGGDGIDALRGGAGNDLIVGGSGSDLLRGDMGDDVFKWTLGDQSATAGVSNAGGSNGLYLPSSTKIVAGATDLIVDFNASTTSGNNDKLDLRDLLQNESHTGTNVGNLGNYLHFETISNTAGGKSTIVHISHDGDFSGGYNNGAAEDQTIVLHGVDLGATGNNDAAVIQDLLTKGKLITD